MTRLTRFFLPTEKLPPADAEAQSHKLMVRAGLRVHRRAEQIIREELDAIGAQEMLMPVLQPAELWQQTGRYGFDEQFRLQDRRGADLVLAMTHEENVTMHVSKVVRSYRDLP